MLFLFTTVNNPKIYVRGNNRCKGERNTDFKEIFVLHLKALFSENCSTGNIGGCSDWSTVTTKRCTGKKSKVKQSGINTKSRNDRKHGSNVRNIVDKCRDKNGCPNDNGEQKELITVTKLCKKLCGIIEFLLCVWRLVNFRSLFCRILLTLSLRSFVLLLLLTTSLSSIYNYICFIIIP